MSKLNLADPVLFFHSVLFNKEEISFDDLLEILEENFGKFLIFTHSYFPMKQYYSVEMGSEKNLQRFFVIYPKLDDREKLVDAKLLSTSLENKHSNEDKRVFNFDAGYISKDQVVLATGKPYSHRVYLAKGVYSELTYRFCGKSYEKLEWTYPDYSHPEIIHKFNWIRQFHFFDKILDPNIALR